jgi:AcrR family transcriptional regulator
MFKTAPKADNAKIASAALLLATRGWANVTLDAVARKTKIPLGTLKKRFVSSVNLVPVIAEEIDRTCFAITGKPTGAPHDVLFDLLMARFDLLQKHRLAILAMSEAARRDKKLACALGKATLDSIYRLIAAARLDAPPRPILAAGLVVIYGWTFCAWRGDKSRDMAKTMATLDRALRWAGKAAMVVTQRS